MARLIPETGETVDETPNLNLPIVDRTGATSGIAFAIIFHDAFIEIDNFLAAFDTNTITNLINDVDQLELDVADLQGQIDSNDIDIANNLSAIQDNDSDIADNAADIIDLQQTKEDAATRATTTNITYDVNQNITSYDNGLIAYSNFVYDTNLELQSYDQTVDGVTTTVTLNRNVDELVESVSVV